MILRVSRLILLVIAALWMPSSPALAASEAETDSQISSVSEVADPAPEAPVSAEDQEFLSLHQESGADLAGGEIDLTDGELVLVIIGSVIVVLLIVAIA